MGLILLLMSLIRGHDMPAGGLKRPATSGPVRFWSRMRRWSLLVVLAVAMGGLGWLGYGFAVFARSIILHEPRVVGKVDGIVVLTGGSQRLVDGLSLLADGHGKRLLISGVYQKTNRDEIARYAGDQRGMLECCVDLGKSARNTIGNAIEARRWAQSNGFKSLLLVTSNYHMQRTLAEFGHVMGEVSLAGYPVVSDSVDVTRVWSDFAAFKLVGSEYLKLVVSQARRTFEIDPEYSRLPILVGRQKPVGPQLIDRAEAN
ncbi:MAG: YdcF family protein [Bosea sp. (in: a-proteobacteria)]